MFPKYVPASYDGVSWVVSELSTGRVVAGATHPRTLPAANRLANVLSNTAIWVAACIAAPHPDDPRLNVPIVP